jgi:hypothetical protein
VKAYQLEPLDAPTGGQATSHIAVDGEEIGYSTVTVRCCVGVACNALRVPPFEPTVAVNNIIPLACSLLYYHRCCTYLCK